MTRRSNLPRAVYKGARYTASFKRAIRTDSVDIDPRKIFEDIDWKYEFDDVDYSKLTNRYKHDAIAHKVVSKPAQDATRNGFRLVMPDDTDLQRQYQKKLDDLKLQDALTTQMIYRGSHGDGYLSIGVKETKPTDTNTPINPQNVQDIAFVHAFGQNHVKEYLTNDDPTSIDYGKEQALVITPTQPGYIIDRYGNYVQATATKDEVQIDSSRYCHISLDKFEGDTHGTSILTRCKHQLNAMGIAIETAAKMLREFTFKIVKSNQMMNESDDEFRHDYYELSQSLNTEATAFINSEDDIIKLSTPTNGINTLLDFAWQDLASASEIPKSVLTGEQMGTLAGASQDIINYYDSIKSIQERLLKPEIEKIVRLLMYATNVAGGPIDPDKVNWSIEFNPLWSPDDKTQAEIEQIKAQTAGVYVDKGIYSPDEVREQLEGQGNNQIQGMTTKSDSVDEDDTPSIEEIKQYKKDMRDACGET